MEVVAEFFSHELCLVVVERLSASASFPRTFKSSEALISESEVWAEVVAEILCHLSAEVVAEVFPTSASNPRTITATFAPAAPTVPCLVPDFPDSPLPEYPTSPEPGCETQLPFNACE